MNKAQTQPPLASHEADYHAIIGLLSKYFDGLFAGEVATLREVFHDDAWLKGPNYRHTRDQWLEAVANRPVPRDEGMAYGFKILSLEIVGDQAMAKVDVPMQAAHFIDFLGLLKEDGRWQIVNKMFVTI